MVLLVTPSLSPSCSWVKPAALRTADGTLPPDAHLVIDQARVRAERDTLSFSALHRTIHVVE